MLVHLLISLNWQSVLVLRQQELDIHFGRSLEMSGISSMDYDISFFQEEHLLTILGDVEKLLQPRLNVLLLCDVTTTVSVLRQLSRFCGTRSNTSVDLCHVSRVLVVGKSDDLPVLLDSNIQVENVALLELPPRQGHSSKARMWTLMFHPNGRAFADVALSNDTIINPTDVFPNVKFGYNGRQFTAVMKDNSFDYDYITVNKRRVFGFPFCVLNLLAEAMNFSYRVIPPREDEWGQNINGSWTGLLGMLQRREADLVSDMLNIHSDRIAVADYLLPPIAETKQVIIYKKEEDVDKDTFLLRQFQPFVFIMFGVSLITCMIFLSSLILVHDKDELHSRKCQTGAWTILGATLKQGSIITSSHDSERILVAAWWMFTTIISAVYCGTIMTTFAVKLETPPFSNMAELAAREDYKIGYDASSITENLLQNSKQSVVMAIKQRVQDLSARDPDVFSSNATKHLQKLWQGKYAYITDVVLTDLRTTNCKLNVIDTKYGKGFVAFHVPKWFPFKQDFRNRYVPIDVSILDKYDRKELIVARLSRKNMSLLSDSGILQRTFQEWFPSTADNGCPVEAYPKAVSLIKIQSIFFAVGAGLVCSSMILVAEIVWYKMKQKLCQR
ncbi:probable glutamate receptor [Haliotis cracherodii]|uniref:probable glutamate receptor n=1 Tax=Haliotis cracherodii TaxID=6455 RepID=UPI0039E8EED5